MQSTQSDQALTSADPKRVLSHYDPGNLPQSLIDALVSLTELPYIKSFSLPFTDAKLWAKLVQAQVGKAKLNETLPSLAMPLIGTGRPIVGFRDFSHRGDKLLGGEIMLMDANECLEPADVYVSGDGLGLDLEKVATAKNLSHAVFYYDPWYKQRYNFCKVFLTRQLGAGEINGTTVEIIGDWAIYKALDPNYIDDLKLKIR